MAKHIELTDLIFNSPTNLLQQLAADNRNKIKSNEIENKNKK
jgi:hypothetical protein